MPYRSFHNISFYASIIHFCPWIHVRIHCKHIHWVASASAPQHIYYCIPNCACASMYCNVVDNPFSWRSHIGKPSIRTISFHWKKKIKCAFFRFSFTPFIPLLPNMLCQQRIVLVAKCCHFWCMLWVLIATTSIPVRPCGQING